MLNEDVLYLPVTRLSAEIRARRIAPVELTQAYLNRIEALEPKLNAFVTVTSELALEQAHQAESEIAAGKIRGPLHGIPYGAKDLLATLGIRTTWGAKPFEDQVFDFDATVVRLLREAGAVLLGKLAMIELAGGLGYVAPQASLTGVTRNPWDTGRWTCGSSSGAGAAVAAAMVGFAIGSETWGSIVCPSSFCGVSGLRPTFGRVSRHGAMALSWTLDKLGPMARSADDCELILAAIAGADPLDEWSSSEPAEIPMPAEAAEDLKVAFVRLDFAKSGEPEVRVAFEKAVERLRQAGVSVEEATLPDLPFEAVANVIVTAEAASAFEDLFRDGRVRQLADRWAPLTYAAAREITAADYVKANRIRSIGVTRMADFFASWDVLLAPGEMMTALPADQSFENVSWADPVGAMGNLCGLPAVSVPCGFGAAHLPVSLCLIGGAFEEAKILGLARYYQGLTDWHMQRPSI
jgi:aspartyl-tRNA(Asn)/glutamyl-tRNA(Gln) amidotransferase subunit A